MNNLLELGRACFFILGLVALAVRYAETEGGSDQEAIYRVGIWLMLCLSVLYQRRVEIK